MKLFRKNQIIITTLALMIAAAGYVSYMNGSTDDNTVAKEVNAEVTQDTYDISDEDEIITGEIFTDEEESPEIGDASDSTGGTEELAMAENTGTETTTEATSETDAGVETMNPGEAVMTQSVVNNVDYAVEMKLNREQIRSQNKESLMNLINNTNITEQQKQSAVDQMVHLTDIAEKEAAAEMLLEAKGFTDVVVSITDESVDVVLDMGEVTDAKRAQVEDIVKRKTNIAAENIVISPIEVAK